MNVLNLSFTEIQNSYIDKYCITTNGVKHVSLELIVQTCLIEEEEEVMKKQVLKIYQPSPKSNHHLLYRNLMFFYSWHFSVLIKMSHLTFSLSTAKEFGLLYLVFNVAIDIFRFLTNVGFCCRVFVIENAQRKTFMVVHLSKQGD